ncbi:hypothetical protein P9112_004297 [Eukaryota sp. TZLM1-RC]
MSTISELPNYITHNIDLADASTFIDLLRQVDDQIFGGFEQYESCLSDSIVSKLQFIADQIKQVLSQGGLVLMAGAGTSGRLAHLCCRRGNDILSSYTFSGKFIPLVAGGNPALISAQEGAEDSSLLAKQDINTYISTDKPIIYIGITCGLSAPYVGVQLSECLKKPNIQTVVLGFSPVALARNTPVPGCDGTFKEILDKSLDQGGLALTPVVGPEAITGSTRMKGGTVTLLLLVDVIDAALMGAEVRCGLASVNSNVKILYNQLKMSQSIKKLMETAGKALMNGNRIFYFGDNYPGQMAVIDASECPPTFGASPSDVQGFITGGWDCLGVDKETFPKEDMYLIDVADFESSVKVSQGDLCLFLSEYNIINEELNRLLSETRSKCQCFVVNIRDVSCRKPCHDENLVDLPIKFDFLSSLICFKLVLNLVSTFAHVYIGKIFQNRMADLRLSNTKLLNRASVTLSKILDISKEVARSHLLTVIYGCPVEETSNTNELDHIEAAVHVAHIVPKAILLALGFSLEESCKIVENSVKENIPISSLIADRM